MTSFPAGSPTSRPGAHPPDVNDVAHFLGAAVNLAMGRFAHDHRALAQRLHWPLEMVNKNPAHAREMVRLDLARHAVVQHITGQAAPPPAPPPPAHRKPPNVLDRLQSAAQQEFDREAFAVTHPIEALANHIHDQRITHGGERHLARANDLGWGGVAAAIADFGEGLGKAADLQRRYTQGGIVTEAVAKRVFGLPAPPSAADQAAKIVAPLRREASLRPPRTFAGRLAAGAPRMAAVVLAPGVAGPLILGTQSLGAAHARARETHAPDTPLNDAGIAATAGIDTLAGLLLKGRGGLDPARVIERLPEAARSDALELSAKVFAKSAAGATIGGAQTTADNLIANGSYDEGRRWNDGLAEGAALGAATAPFGMRSSSTASPRRPLMFAAPVPPHPPGSFKILYAGAHKDLRLPGFEAHHVPANASSPLSTARGPAMLLSREDHLKTASHGNGRAAREYRRRQQELIDAGDLAGAQDMDIEDIRSKFGNKYDLTIEELLSHSKEKGYRR